MIKPCTAALLCAFLCACQPIYQPVTDGRVSVLDLTLFPSAYADQEVITYGYLDWRDNAATLFFDDDHITRKAARFAIPVALPEDLHGRAEECSGKEVLMRGQPTQVERGWVLKVEDDFVC